MTRRGQEKYRFVEILHLQVESSNDGKRGFQACTACLQPFHAAESGFKFHFSVGTSRGAPQLTYVLNLEGVRRCLSTVVSDSSDWSARPQGKLAMFTNSTVQVHGQLYLVRRCTPPLYSSNPPCVAYEPPASLGILQGMHDTCLDDTQT